MKVEMAQCVMCLLCEPDDLFGDNRLDSRLDQLFNAFGPSSISSSETSRLPWADHYLSLGPQDFDSEILWRPRNKGRKGHCSSSIVYPAVLIRLRFSVHRRERKKDCYGLEFTFAGRAAHRWRNYRMVLSINPLSHSKNNLCYKTVSE